MNPKNKDHANPNVKNVNLSKPQRYHIYLQ